MNYFLNNFSEWKRKNIKKSFTLEPRYFYWCNTLLEYAIRLFTWSGLPESIPQHEIEFATLTHGYGVFVKKANGEWIAPFNYARNGITDYYDIFTHVNFSTPLSANGNREIGKTAIIVPNNSLKMSLMPKIQSYATILAHVDISLICELVNDRQSVLNESINNSQADKANTYLDRLYNGEISTIINTGFDVLKFTDLNKRSQGEVEKLIVIRNKVLQAYLEEIGIRKQQEKKERMISDEATGNIEMLKLNISDMLECRQKSAQQFSEILGKEITVTCNIDYLNSVENSVDIVEKGVEKE
jgi:hypothetical protein